MAAIKKTPRSCKFCTELIQWKGDGWGLQESPQARSCSGSASGHRPDNALRPDQKKGMMKPGNSIYMNP